MPVRNPRRTVMCRRLAADGEGVEKTGITDVHGVSYPNGELRFGIPASDPLCRWHDRRRSHRCAPGGRASARGAHPPIRRREPGCVGSGDHPGRGDCGSRWLPGRPYCRSNDECSTPHRRKRPPSTKASGPTSPVGPSRTCSHSFLPAWGQKLAVATPTKSTTTTSSPRTPGRARRSHRTSSGCGCPTARHHRSIRPTRLPTSSRPTSRTTFSNTSNSRSARPAHARIRRSVSVPGRKLKVARRARAAPYLPLGT